MDSTSTVVARLLAPHLFLTTRSEYKQRLAKAIVKADGPYWHMLRSISKCNLDFFKRLKERLFALDLFMPVDLSVDKYLELRSRREE